MVKRIRLHQSDIATGGGIGALLLLVTWLAYLDGGAGGSFIHFYYIPIVTASFFLGDLGGIVAAFAAALLAALLPLREGVGQSEVISLVLRMVLLRPEVPFPDNAGCIACLLEGLRDSFR